MSGGLVNKSVTQQFSVLLFIRICFQRHDLWAERVGVKACLVFTQMCL